MKPVIAIVGRPNVGKSTLFNALTKTRDALVYDIPGVTRDRIYGDLLIDEQTFILIDTGGVEGKEQGIQFHMVEQTQQAIDEADMIIFLVDAKAGITGADQEITNFLRKIDKPLLLLVNKAEGQDTQMSLAEFHQLGLGDPVAISAAHRRGLNYLLERITEILPDTESTSESMDELTFEKEIEGKAIKIAFVGRPNVGKSTLINRILGEDRVVVYDQPGTTRDSVYIPFIRREQNYLLIDTAGVRRRGRIIQTLEKFSIVKTLQAVKDSHVSIVVIDASEGITEQDLHLIGYCLEAGRALVIAINKWDGLDEDQRDKVNADIERRLQFVQFARHRKISALHGTGVGDLFKDVTEAYRAATTDLKTADLTALLEQAQAQHSPPTTSSGRRIKLRYAHPGGSNPPTIIIHGKMTKQLPNSYHRYLENFYRKALKLVGTPLRVIFRDAENPYVKDE